nr:iron ABC transporter permease [Selenomonas ruminantium]
MSVLPLVYLTAGLVSIFFTILFAISVGVVDIPLAEVLALLGERSGLMKGITISSAHHDILWELRLPRVLLAGFAGAGLSLCGMVMQALVQNPLAEPYILGVASGASLGAVAVILLGGTAFLAGIGVPLGAFLGAVAATGFVLALAGKERSASAVRLILAGAVVSALFSALANLVVYLANDAEGMRSAAFWTMGSLAGARWDSLWLPGIAVLVGAVFFALRLRELNAMLLGEETAVTLGVDLIGARRRYLALTALLTGIIVSVCGIFGFVGLIIPHAVRAVVGSDHRRVLPGVLIVGAIFLILADVLCRVLLPSGDLPIGILTALVGAPLFMRLLFRTENGLGR